MKRCPACSRVYDDDSLRFCLDDGTNLVERSPTEPAPATLVLPATPEPVPTMRQDFPLVVPPVNAAAPGGEVVPKKRNVLLWVVGLVLLLMFGAGAIAGALVIYKKRALTWHLVLEVQPSSTDRDAAVKQSVTVIEKRLNELGVPHYEVRPRADASGRIDVNLPAVEDPERLKSIITSAGKLELVHVISPPSPEPSRAYSTKEEATASISSGGSQPTNRRILPYLERAEPGNSQATTWVAVESPAIVDGSELRNATAVLIREGGSDYEIDFSLNQTGADKFGAWTGSNINQYLGVVLNGEVKSIAYIKSQITDQGVIQGRFNKQSAEDLALVLRSGALPAAIKIVSENIDK